MDFDVTRALASVLEVLLPALDIVADRVDDTRVPDWCASRGWSDFLLGLTQRDLERCEAEGLAPVASALNGVPRSLAELARQVCELSALPTLEVSSVERAVEDYRGVSERKREQLSMLLGALTKMAAPAERILDVGAGSGHFTRLAARHFDRATLGLERNPERVESASARALRRPEEAGFSAQFAVVDACREPLSLGSTDLAIGLHACGELGDALVTAVAASGADLALISCCLQKISQSVRTPLSRAASRLALPRDILGLSNLTSQTVGVEAHIEQTMRARRARYALRRLLAARGLDIPPGAEMRGINRRRAHAGLLDIAGRALLQRGLPPVTAAELAGLERQSALDFELVRRLSLPRNMLARAIELGVVLDRAMHLHESGYAVRVATLFDRAVTPRNISLFASRDPERLPRVRSHVARSVRVVSAM
jgi:SAM-dependent methyltransferase